MNVLLDTSILQCAEVKKPVVSSVVSQSLSQLRTKGASEYALLEFNNAVITSAAHLEKLLRDYKDFDLALEYVDRITAASFSDRKAKMCRELSHRLEIELRAEFDPIYPRDRTDFYAARAEHAATLLKRFQQSWIRDLRRIVDKWQRGTECFWVTHLEAQPYSAKKVVSKIKCDARIVRCKIVEFLEQHRSELSTVLVKIEGLSEEQLTGELKKMRVAIVEFLKSPNTAADYSKGCSRFADLIHVLESKNYDAVFSMNAKEFAPLCGSLGKRLIVQSHRGTPADLSSNGAS